jgi:hypothetical protein
MMKHPATSRTIVNFLRAAGILALASSMSTLAQAQQDQQGQDQPQTQEQPQQQPPDSPPKPTYAPQDADKPPYSHDRPRQAPSGGQAPAEQPPQPVAPLPETLTIPAGTILLIRTNDFLSSDRNHIGDQFTAVLEQPVVVNGWVVARRGQVLIGQVKAAEKAGRIKGVSQLGVELTDMTVADGRQVPILTELWKGSGGTTHGHAAAIGGTTGLGALIGAAAGWGKGAAIGAGAGAAAGIGAVLLTRGRPTELEPETPLSFRLVDPVTIDTTPSRQAFLPVTQQDFDGGHGGRRRPRLAAGYPGPRYGPCGYYGCYGYPVYFGYYEGYGWGPGHYGRRWYHY